jgi:hypothetical protein
VKEALCGAFLPSISGSHGIISPTKLPRWAVIAFSPYGDRAISVFKTREKAFGFPSVSVGVEMAASLPKHCPTPLYIVDVRHTVSHLRHAQFHSHIYKLEKT